MLFKGKVDAACRHRVITTAKKKTSTNLHISTEKKNCIFFQIKPNSLGRFFISHPMTDIIL